MNHKQKNIITAIENQAGQAVLTTVLFVLFISIAAVAGFSSVAFTETKTANKTLMAEKTYYLSEAGVEDVVYRILAGKQYSPTETLSLDGAMATTTTTTSGSAKIVISQGNVSGNIRKIKTTIGQGSQGSFVYGVQVGRGGIRMQNSSMVIGSVYSDGDIIGQNSPQITGDALVATTKKIDGMTVNGSARAYLITNSTVGINATSTTDIDDVTVSKHAYANRIIDSTITNNAYYETSISGSSVGGTTYPGTPAPAELPELDFSVSDDDLDGWEDIASSGGTISSPCPYKPADGESIGPVKITCDVTINGTKNVTITGPIWISGNLTMRNSAILKLASSYGNSSDVVIVDNQSNRTTSSKISVENSSQILGSGTSGSYVLVVSRNTSSESGGTEDAISIRNSSNAPIYFAPHGLVGIENPAALKEVTAYKLEIRNSATITYESGLANVHFSTGPTGGFSVERWSEIE